MIATCLLTAALGAPTPVPELSIGPGFAATGGHVESLSGDARTSVQLRGLALAGRTALGVQIHDRLLFGGFFSGFWIPRTTELWDGVEYTPPGGHTPRTAVGMAGLFATTNFGPELRLTLGLGVAQLRFQIADHYSPFSRPGLGWDLQFGKTFSTGLRWDLGVAIGSTGHLVPKVGPSVTVWSGGEVGVRLLAVNPL